MSIGYVIEERPSTSLEDYDLLFSTPLEIFLYPSQGKNIILPLPTHLLYLLCTNFDRKVIVCSSKLTQLYLGLYEFCVPLDST